MMIFMDGTVIRGSQRGNNHRHNSRRVSVSSYEEDNESGTINSVTTGGPDKIFGNSDSTEASSGVESVGYQNRQIIASESTSHALSAACDRLSIPTSGEAKACVPVHDMASTSSSSGKRDGRNWTICWYLLLTVLVLLVAALIGMGGFLTTKALLQKQNDSSKDASSGVTNCVPEMIKDTMKPLLELYMAGPTRLADEAESADLKQAVLAGFNQAADGCNDKYERWMYGAHLVNQTLLHNSVLVEEMTDGVGSFRNASNPLENHFEDGFTLVARFRMIISCDGCSEDSAFASEYPESFGDDPVSGNRRNLLFRYLGRRSLSSMYPPQIGVGRGAGSIRGESVSTDSVEARELQKEAVALNAGKVLVSIEKAILHEVDMVKAVVRAKIENPTSGETYELENTGWKR